MSFINAKGSLIAGVFAAIWSRYIRGVVSPPLERRMRIESILPGTERHYSSSLWTLAEHREFSWSELRGLVNGLQKLFRDGFVEDGRSISAKGRFWRRDSDRFDLLKEVAPLVSDQKYGYDALTTILFLMREAELQQDGYLYLFTMIELASAECDKNAHLILRAIPIRFFEKIVEPLRWMRFADANLNDDLDRWFARYGAQYKAKRSTCDMLDFLRHCARY